MNFTRRFLSLTFAFSFATILFASAASADVEVTRAWSAAAPTIDGVVSPGEWTAGTLTTLTHAKMRTMNDAAFLYVLLDVVDDTHDDAPAHAGPGTGDSFVLAIDVDQNHGVTPHIDLDYDTCNDGRTFIKDYYLSANTFTGCQTVDALTQGAMGFGTTPGFPFNHRFWEFRLSFGEIGVDPSTWTTSSGSTPNVRVNVATVSEIPAFSTAQPDASLFPAFGNTYQVDLATSPVYPLGSDGPVFAGVGLVPSTFIEASGVATINIANYYSAKDAPFGGKLNIFGHWATLSSMPAARKYRVVYSKDGGPWTRLLQTWTNFRFTAGTWVPISVGPDGDDAYAIPDPTEIWYLPNLLISWQSNLFANGTYQLKLEILNNGGGLLGSPVGNSLTLFVDNTPPVPTINQVMYDGTPLCDCAIVTQGVAPAHGFTFRISVTDANGALDGFSLGGVFGNNLSTPTLYSDTYVPTHVDADGANRWNGVTNILVPATAFHATTSCAYTYTLSASSRVQNGYGRLFTNEQYHYSFTTLLGTDPLDPGTISCP